MTPEQFIESVQMLLKRTLPVGSYIVTDIDVFPGRGGIVKVDLSGVLAMFVMEFSRDFVTKVAAPVVPNEWYNFPEVLLLVEHRPYTSDSTSVGKSFAEFEAQFQKLKSNLAQIRRMFSDEKRNETVEQLASIRTQAVQPLMDLFAANSAKPKG